MLVGEAWLEEDTHVGCIVLGGGVGVVCCVCVSVLNLSYYFFVFCKKHNS